MTNAPSSKMPRDRKRKVIGAAGSVVAAILFAAAPMDGAEEIAGTVRDVSGSNATVVTEETWLAAIGDSVEIFFKLAGADEEISVASGTVTSVDAQVAKVKIEQASGTVQKDQLARIKPRSGAKPTVKSRASPPSAGLAVASPPASASPFSSAATPFGKSNLQIRPAKSSLAAPVSRAGAKSPLHGDWTGVGPDGAKVSFSFKPNNTLLWVVEDPGTTVSTRAKYRLNTIVIPHAIEIFDIQDGAARGEALRGIFELQSDGRLKLDASIGYREKPEQGFTDGAIIFSRAASPIVVPPAPSPPSPLPAQVPKSP